MSNPIWAEIFSLDFVTTQKIKEPKTVVTPYVYECFKHMRFAHHLKPVEFDSLTKPQDSTLGKDPSLTSSSTNPSHLVVEIPSNEPPNVPENSTEKEEFERKQMIQNIKVGDVLSVTKDGKGSVWKDEISKWKAIDACWYAYIQGVHERRDKRSFDALWLYKPSDTSCAMMKYPFASNELFMSDNCTCKSGKITEDEVLAVMSVSWYCQQPKVTTGIFIRSTYLENERYVTLKEAHKNCSNKRPATRNSQAAKCHSGLRIFLFLFR